MYSPDDFNRDENTEVEEFNYKHTMRDFHKRKYTTEIGGSFEEGYYINILLEGKLLTTITVFTKDSVEAEEEALNTFVKQRHGY